MKKISILALVLALTMAMSVSVSASKGFYNIGTATDVTIVPEANGTAVTTATEVDIDLAVDEENNKANETLYDGSNGLDVTLANASSGSYYGVLLIEGSTLPTVDDAIHYIDQVTADGTSVNFNVLPIIPTKGEDETANGVPMTLYISSNATDAKLVSVPLNYAYEGTYAPVSTTPVEPEILLGDVTGDTFVDFEDAYVINLFDAWDFERIIEEGYEQFWDDDDESVAAAIADVTGDSFVDFEDAYVINLYDAWDFERIIEEGYEQFWPDEE